MHPDDLPTDRPTTLELTTVTGSCFPFDATAPAGWNWTPFPIPRHRFDSISGSHRLRYAAALFNGAARERFDATDRIDGDQMLDTCGTLTDRLAAWFGDDLHGILYRSGTTPQRSTNLAFSATAPLTVESTIRLRQLPQKQLSALVVLHGFHFEDESLLDR